ncbi:hypothetical protein BAE44_0000783 [Dichanthelium oligosanthes]|uniref:Uncharacterized protein n=1 Tax=Dichanthelium oligosanthes TaxID=888268 RepID=A0A1E5WLE6_9POAL|nr:hypothetical protein BAE44_0000783 [Dichanthelium oligosanthes]
MSSCSERHSEKPTPASAAQAARDWAALPWDIVFDVFLKLGPREVMLGAEFACTAWRHVALREPALWRRVGMDDPTTYDGECRPVDDDLETEMSLVAVGRAAGQCEAFKGYCGDEDLITLVESYPLLETLHITGYFGEDEMDEELRVKCARVKNLTLPTRTNRTVVILFILTVAMVIILKAVRIILKAMRIILKTVRSRSKTNPIWAVTRARIACSAREITAILLHFSDGLDYIDV